MSNLRRDIVSGLDEDDLFVQFSSSLRPAFIGALEGIPELSRLDSIGQIDITLELGVDLSQGAADDPVGSLVVKVAMGVPSQVLYDLGEEGSALDSFGPAFGAALFSAISALPGGAEAFLDRLGVDDPDEQISQSLVVFMVPPRTSL